MAYTYEDVIPSLIPNTTMKKRLLNEAHRSYIIAPIDGYVLHDNAADGIDFESDAVIRRYSIGDCSCGANYDFSTIQLIVPDINGNDVVVTTYGSREFYAIPESEVSADQVYSGGNHEVM